MPRTPKDPDKTPKPRASRGKSGKPSAPPRETAAGTPDVRAGRAEKARAASETGFAEAPQTGFETATARVSDPLGLTPRGDHSGLNPEGKAPGDDGVRPGGSDTGPAPRPTLPALRQQGPRPPMAGEATSRYLDALLAKPAERSERAREMLQTQPMLATHPLVSGEQATFVPHRPPRPEKSEGGRRLTLVSAYEPKGDQPTAIAELVAGIKDSERDQVLLGVTGSGKTYTMAQVISETQRPALILAPNKTLAAQLYGEFKSFFPENAVEYFVSYYDYYQPEAYVPRTDTYIEKESSINEQIDRMRHAATRSLLERDDVIIVA